VVLWALIVHGGLHAQLTVLAGLVWLFIADRLFNFRRRCHHDAGAADRRMTTAFSPHRRRHAACLWACLLGFAWVPHADFKSFVKVCLDTWRPPAGAVHCGSGQHFCWMLTATGVTAAISDGAGFTQNPYVFLLLAIC